MKAPSGAFMMQIHAAGPRGRSAIILSHENPTDPLRAVAVRHAALKWAGSQRLDGAVSDDAGGHGQRWRVCDVGRHGSVRCHEIDLGR